MRFLEAVQSYNLIIDLSRRGKLNDYYNEANETLEHFRFKEVFIRRTKKAFISFVPLGIVKRVSQTNPLNWRGIETKIKRGGLPLKFGDVREAHATFLTKYLKESEIDFLHGRIGVSVFMRNYFNPALINDLKQRTLKAVRDIQAKIS